MFARALSNLRVISLGLDTTVAFTASPIVGTSHGLRITNLGFLSFAWQQQLKFYTC